MKIDKLTPEQEARMPEYVSKWINIATSTQEISDDVSATISADFRGLIGLKKNVPIVWGKNPIECWVICCLHEQGVSQDSLQSEMEKVFAGKSTYEIPQASLPYNTTLLSYVFSFYDFMFTEVGVKIDDELYNKYKTWEKTSAIWAIYPLNNLTVLCRKPLEVHLNSDRVLHKEAGPALKFDGLGDFQIFALNGTRVPEYLAVMESHQIPLDSYLKETSADVKAEFVQKVGIERFLEMGKLVDTYKNYDQEDHPFWWQSEYEVWDMGALFPELPKVRYLKMKNFTTGVWHMEGISPDMGDSLKDALKDRFDGDMKIVAAA